MSEGKGRGHALQVAAFLDSLVNEYGHSLAVAVPIASNYALGLAQSEQRVLIRQEERKREPWEDAD